MQNLNIRYPHLYITSNCSRCSHTEDSLHLFLCSKNETDILQLLNNLIHETLFSLQISNILPITLLNILLQFTLNSPNPQYKHILHAITGTYTITTYNNIKEIANKQTNSLLLNLSNNLLNMYFHKLWFTRNIYQHQWEQA